MTARPSATLPALTSVEEMVEAGLLPAEGRAALEAVAAGFKIRMSGAMRAALAEAGAVVPGSAGAGQGGPGGGSGARDEAGDEVGDEAGDGAGQGRLAGTACHDGPSGAGFSGASSAGPAPSVPAFDDRGAVARRGRAAAFAPDPIAAQFVPDARELIERPEELADPIGDAAHSPVPGLTHRYPDRVILHVTRICAVYCRFCFRREVVGEEGHLPEAELAAALDYIRATPAIREVILTGGDPMALSARRLSALLDRLDAIPHLEVIRFHTRVPAVAPERIDAAMLAALGRRRATVYVVLHTNHAREITAAAAGALGRLAGAGVPLLSQTVLLRGVNAEAPVLAELFRLLIRHRVKPYYLHHCDLARGTGHFRTTIAEGLAIMAALRGHVSGLCLPTYVLDLPGGHGKVPLGSDNVERLGPGRYRIRDFRGQSHLYEDAVPGAETTP